MLPGWQVKRLAHWVQVQMAWYIFAPQCASTLAVIKRETGGWRFMFITFAYMLALAYVAALVVYQVARALGAG